MGKKRSSPRPPAPKPVDPLAPTLPSMPAVTPPVAPTISPSSSGEHEAVRELQRQMNALDDLAGKIERGESLPPSTPPPPDDPAGPITLRPEEQRRDNKPRDERLLIADDDVRMTDLLKKELEDWGYKVLIAYDGVEALDLLTSRNPDVLILDIGMPRLSGNAVLAAMQADDIRVPVIVISAGDLKKLKFQNPDMAEKFAFHKTALDMDHLKEKIRQLVNERRAMPRY